MLLKFNRNTNLALMLFITIVFWSLQYDYRKVSLYMFYNIIKDKLLLLGLLVLSISNLSNLYYVQLYF